MAASRKAKLVVCAYLPADEKYPVLCVQVQLPPNRKFGSYHGPVVRRCEAGYEDLYRACNGKPIWLYGQQPTQLC